MSILQKLYVQRLSRVCMQPQGTLQMNVLLLQRSASALLLRSCC